MSPPVPQTVVIGKQSIWVANKIKLHYFPEKIFITNPLFLEEQNSFKIIGTWAEQFSGMGNFAMTIWNSTCNPCFSTFDQIFFVFHGLKTFFLLFIEA
jgi:hypothetical protein